MWRALLRKLLPSRDDAKEVARLAEKAAKAMEKLVEYERRAGRDAEVGDLEESIQKVRLLVRK